MPIHGAPAHQVLHQDVYDALCVLTRCPINWAYVGGFGVEFSVDLGGASVDFTICHVSGGGRHGPPGQKIAVLELRLESGAGVIVMSQTATGKDVEPYGTSDTELDRLVKDVRIILIGYIIAWLNTTVNVSRTA